MTETYRNRIIWRLTARVNHHFEELCARLAEIPESHPDTPVLKDEILALPGHPHPHNYDPIRDLIIREVIGEPSNISKPN